MMTRGREGVWIPPKSDDVIYEQPLMIMIRLLIERRACWTNGLVDKCWITRIIFGTSPSSWAIHCKPAILTNKISELEYPRILRILRIEKQCSRYVILSIGRTQRRFLQLLTNPWDGGLSFFKGTLRRLECWTTSWSAFSSGCEDNSTETFYAFWVNSLSIWYKYQLRSGNKVLLFIKLSRFCWTRP